MVLPLCYLVDNRVVFALFLKNQATVRVASDPFFSGKKNPTHLHPSRRVSGGDSIEGLASILQLRSERCTWVLYNVSLEMTHAAQARANMFFFSRALVVSLPYRRPWRRHREARCALEALANVPRADFIAIWTTSLTDLGNLAAPTKICQVAPPTICGQARNDASWTNFRSEGKLLGPEHLAKI